MAFTSLFVTVYFQVDPMVVFTFMILTICPDIPSIPAEQFARLTGVCHL